MPKSKSKLPSAYDGGYTTEKMKRLEEVKIPDKVPCEACKKLKTTHISFSKKQIMKYKNDVATRKILPAQQQLPMWMTCVTCSPKPKTEMVCIQCQHWKDLDGFTKVQRRNPDMAVCKTCVYAITTASPMDPSGGDQLRHYHDDDSDEDDSENETNPYCPTDAGDSVSGVPISGPSTFKLNDENLKAVPSAAGNANAWKQYAQSSQASGKQQEYIAYDADGNAHTKIHTPSIADTEESFAATRASRVTDHEIRNITRKFAKAVGAPSKPTAPAEYVGARAVDEDDDGSDSDGSYGYI